MALLELLRVPWRWVAWVSTLMQRQVTTSFILLPRVAGRAVTAAAVCVGASSIVLWGARHFDGMGWDGGDHGRCCCTQHAPRPCPRLSTVLSGGGGGGDHCVVQYPPPLGGNRLDIRRGITRGAAGTSNTPEEAQRRSEGFA